MILFSLQLLCLKLNRSGVILQVRFPYTVFLRWGRMQASVEMSSFNTA
jgi:hypothetical protein